MGWRYYLWTIGALVLALFVTRALVFRLHESPKFLVGRGRDAGAVAVVHALARRNGRASGLTVGMLESAGAVGAGEGEGEEAHTGMGTGTRAAFARRVSVLNADHVRALFKTRRLAYSTTLLVVLWGAPLVPHVPPLTLTLTLTLVTAASRSVHRARVPVIQRLHHRVPADARRGLWRWLAVRHVSQRECHSFLPHSPTPPYFPAYVCGASGGSGGADGICMRST